MKVDRDLRMLITAASKNSQRDKRSYDERDVIDQWMKKYPSKAKQSAAASADNYARERAKRPRKMECTCCGQTYIGRQWWNQDTGYGLGDCCVSYCKVDPNGGESSCYGVPGIHFLIDKEASK